MEHTLQLGEILKDGMYPVESEGGDNWRILHGDTLKLVKAFQPGTFDAVITDPPYASGGTKQNERNRTTNQKYSSMSPEKALPDFDGDQKDQRSWTHCVDQHIIIWHFRRIKLCRNNAGIFHPRTPGILVITVIEKIITVITRLKMGYFNFPDSANYGIK